MSIIVFLIITIFIAVIQTIIPYLMKRTVVFGVTIPVQYIQNQSIRKYKKQYAISVALLSAAIIVAYVIWALTSERLDEQIAIAGAIIEFALIFISLSWYFYYHGKTKQLKNKNKWTENLKQIKVTDLSVRNQDEMLPWYVYILPMLISIGLIIYTILNYNLLPNEIPTHWGPNGKPDAFTEKTLFSSIQMIVFLLVMQLMFLGIHIATKNSGIKLSATNLQSSRNRQLSLRKYSSWFMLFTLLAITMLMSYFQLTTIHPNIVSDYVMLALPLVFLIIILIGTLIFGLKVGSSDKVVDVSESKQIMDIDEDQYWKGGMFYFNKNDPSIFVEKRFGVGWTINFANPIGYIILILPIIIILVFAYIN